jgi:hypothetical protein
LTWSRFDVVYNGGTVNVLMAPELLGDGPNKVLSDGPFADDPRTNNVPDAPHDGVDDPPNKRAVIYIPFLHGADNTWDYHGVTVSSVVGTFADVKYLSSEEAALRGDGYEVDELDGANAGIAGLIQALSGPTPGFLAIRTHGWIGGDLFTSDYLGATLAAAVKAQDAINAKLAKEYDMPASADFLGVLPTTGGKNIFGFSAYFLEVTPLFWSWLRGDRGVDFSRSFVFMGACLTDATPDLRDAIMARAYFAWNVSAVNETDAAIMDYIIQMLVKPTFSTEEVYYNLLRLDTSGLIAYRSDVLLGNTLISQSQTNTESHANPAGAPYTFRALQYVFDAWGDHDGQMIPYIGNGWLSDGIDEGEIWTMLWAARWGKDTKQGIKNLQGCWDGVWSKGTVGAINSTCQLWTDGNVPTKDELDYTIYLLTGDSSGLSITPVPRFTLNDAGS